MYLMTVIKTRYNDKNWNSNYEENVKISIKNFTIVLARKWEKCCSKCDRYIFNINNHTK